MQREPREPRDPEEERDEDHLAGPVIGDVVDDRAGADEDDGQPGPRQHRVADAAEQERRSHPGEVHAGHERDEPAVDERERRPEQPERRGRAERVAPAQQQEQHHHDARRDAEPQRGVGRVLGVAPDDELDDGRHGEHDDDHVERVPAREVSEPAHGLNVLDVREHRLLLE